MKSPLALSSIRRSSALLLALSATALVACASSGEDAEAAAGAVSGTTTTTCPVGPPQCAQTTHVVCANPPAPGKPAEFDVKGALTQAQLNAQCPNDVSPDAGFDTNPCDGDALDAASLTHLIAPGDTMKQLGSYSLRFRKRRVSGTGESPWAAPETGAKPRLIVAASGGNAADITDGFAYVNFLETAPSVSFGIQDVPAFHSEGRRQDALLYFVLDGPKLVGGIVDTFNSFLHQPVRVRRPILASESPSGSARIDATGFTAAVKVDPKEENTAVTASCAWVRGTSAVANGQQYQYAMVARY